MTRKKVNLNRKRTGYIFFHEVMKSFLNTSPDEEVNSSVRLVLLDPFDVSHQNSYCKTS